MVEDKPKSALDWIRWGQGQKKQAPAAPPPAKAPPADAAPAAGPDWMASQKPPAKEPPAPPTREAVEETAGRGAIEEEVEFDEFEGPDGPDDFDRLMADVSVADAPVADALVADAPVADVPAAEPPAAPVPEPEVAVATVPEANAPAFDDPGADDPAFDDPGADDQVAGLWDDPAPIPPVDGPQLPAAANSTVYIPEQSAYTFDTSDFNFNEAGGRELAYVEILALPGDGSLRFDHADVSMGQQISGVDIEAGRFVFIPARGARSSVDHDSFLYKVNDGESSSRVAYTMTINVLPVDD